MTIRIMRNGKKLIAWDPGDEVDWTTPDFIWYDHVFCGNCGLDVPGCGCPRGCERCWALKSYCGHLGGNAGG